jgi:alkylation response protein AidB-like acyl-CoA dehydrogenase
MERRGELDDWLLEKVYDDKLFKLFVPRELNGLASGLPEALRAFERMSWIDGSLGWLVTIGSGGGFFAATLPARSAAELFSGRQAVLAGSGMPTGTARKIDGGYRVSGSWSFCSGATFATFFTANCKIDRGKGASEEAEIRSFAFLPKQVSVEKDWNPLGLRATASHTIEVRDAYVPDEMTFDILAEPRYDDPIYRYPFLAFAQTSFAAASIGVARHFLEECGLFAAGKAPEWRGTSPRRLAALERAIAERSAALAEASDRFYERVDATWETFAAAGSLTDLARREIGRVSQEAAAAARTGSEAIFPLLGMTALRFDHPLSRTWRDLHTVTQHSVLLPENEE